MKHVEQQTPHQQRGSGCNERWICVYAVALSTYSVVTTEMLPVGLMTPIADTLGTSVGVAGLTISVPAILAALFAPIAVLAAGGMDRRRILAALLLLLIIANLTSALAPTIGWLLAARVIVGFCMGGIWAIAGGLATRLVSQRSIGLATAIIFGGVAAASVFGVPIGAAIGDFAGWRAAFGAMAFFSVLVLAVNLWSLPELPVSRSVRLRAFRDQIARHPIQLGLATTFLFVAGHFMAYTFVRPLLQNTSGIGVEWIGVLLFAYGAAGIAGNFLCGLMVSRHTAASLIAIAVALAATISGFALFGDTPMGGTLILVLWGIAYGGVSVGLQSWMMKAAPSAIEVATALFVSIFNISIALGSLAGGQIVDRFGLQTNLLLAAVLPVLGLIFAIAIHRHSMSIASRPAAAPAIIR
ncbi:MAG: MFS transporter [Pseudomonadota bacterium]|nr:MFS transporter [Pseudomonadota bacterium]